MPSETGTISSGQQNTLLANCSELGPSCSRHEDTAIISGQRTLSRAKNGYCDSSTLYCSEFRFLFPLMHELQESVLVAVFDTPRLFPSRSPDIHFPFPSFHSEVTTKHSNISNVNSASLCWYKGYTNYVSIAVDCLCSFCIFFLGNKYRANATD